jgi:hypothetical protein
VRISPFKVANVSQLTSLLSSHLINTSGSGKTRILFEGLCRYWGLYFTSGLDLGSQGMAKVLESLSSASNFTKELSSTSDLGPLDHNRMIAHRRFRQVLIAHLFVLRMFLEAARKVCPEGPLDRYRRHWLFLQLLPRDVVGNDIFLELTMILNKASDNYLGVKKTTAEKQEVTNLLRDIEGITSARLYLVLDEAQIPARLYRGAYRSADTSKERPILREILSAWDQLGYTIVAGTGLSVKEVKELVDSTVAKLVVRWRTCTKTGAFDSPEAQSSYISRYLPPHLLQNDHGRLLDRCWSWLRGRYVSDISLILIDA